MLIKITVIALSLVLHKQNANCISSPDPDSLTVSSTPHSSENPVLPNHSDVETSILRNLSSNQFLSKIRPNGTTHVRVNLQIREVQMKNGNKNKLSLELFRPWTVDLTLRQYWNDPRLSFNSNNQLPYFPLNSAKSIWKPDLFFPDAENGEFHYVTAPNALVWIYPNGDVTYSLRISLTLPCRQASIPRRFGHGIGIPVACPLRMASYGYTEDQLSFDWVDKDALEAKEELYTQLDSSNNYCSLDKISTNETSRVVTRTGSYSVLPTEFQFLC